MPPVDVARLVVAREDDTRYEDAEVVEELDVSGLLAHHVDTVDVLLRGEAETDIDVVVFVDGDRRVGLVHETGYGRELRGSRGHGGSLRASGNGRDVRLYDVVEDLVELRLVLLVFTHRDRDDALLARKFGREDEHAVAGRRDDGGAFFVEIDVQRLGIGAEILAFDDDLSGDRTGRRGERFENDGLVGPVARITPSLAVGARRQPADQQAGEPQVQPASKVEVFHTRWFILDFQRFDTTI